MRALIDGDVVVYAAGFASDAAAKARGLEHEPWNYQRQGINEMLYAVQKTVEATRTTIYLSHPVNHREILYPPYKQNRDVLHKPFWYSEIKEYLLDKGALFSEEGDEADDALGIAQDEDSDTIICTNDKDLDMIAGFHYNWSPKRKANGVYFIDEVEGLRNFYTQMLTGDATDNIPGLYKATGQKATQAIKAGLDSLYTETEMYDYVLATYKGNQDFLNTIGPLLWIKREKGDFWRAP